MSSDAPRSVKIARWAVGALALVPLSSLLLWIYQHEIKPYEVRYYAGQLPNHPTKFEVSIYSDDDAADSALVSLDCHPDNLIDVTYRPVLEEARDWSLREIFPSVPEVNSFLRGGNNALADEIGDRHLSGGLSEWEGLERIQLQNRLSLAIAKSNTRLTLPERKQLEQQFALVGILAPHQTNTIVFPQQISRADQIAIRNAIDRVQQGWERSTAAINSNWILRWQTMTGTSLVAPIKGVGSATPLYLVIPPLKRGSGVVLGVERESSVAPQTVKVVVGDTTAYRVPSRDDLKAKSIFLLLKGEWWLVPLLIAVLAIAAAVYYSYWRWPKHLKDPKLFEEAQQRNSDELWGELRARNTWVESYVMASFFSAKIGMIPNSDAISYFWRQIRGTLSTHPVTAANDAQVRLAILDILDRSIQNALT
ncbi:MAG TPA: hypothetical protein VGJ33_09380 [Candidatus Angelobacter sp.]|jgi:hypothetical protein